MVTEERFGHFFFDDIAEWMADNLEPEEVYTEEQLREWALENGYIESEGE